MHNLIKDADIFTPRGSNPGKLSKIIHLAFRNSSQVSPEVGVALAAHGRSGALRARLATQATPPNSLSPSIIERPTTHDPTKFPHQLLRQPQTWLTLNTTPRPQLVRTFTPSPSLSPRPQRQAHTLCGRTWLTRCTALKAKRAFRKFSYRGVDLDQYVSRRSR